MRDVGRTIWHNGETGGYHSYVAFDPQQQLGVVLLSSSSIGTVDGMGYRLLRWLAGEPAPSPPAASGAPTVTLCTGQLDALVGLYQLTPLFEIEIKRDGDHLIGQATGQPALRLFATSDTHFFLRALPAEIDLVRDPAGRISELVLHQNGQNLHGKRRLAPR